MKNNFSLLTHKGRWLLATLTLLFTFAIGNVWANQTDLISGKTLPDMPTASLNMATQSTFTPDANGWIVFDPYASAANLSTIPAWWKHTAKATQGPGSAFDPSSVATTAPFVARGNESNTFRTNTGNTAAIRFTGAEKISFLVHPRSNSSGKEIYVAIFTYDSGADPTQAQITGSPKKTSSNAYNELIFEGLTTSNTYVAYVYNGGTSQNGCLCEIAIKAPVNKDGPYAVTYDKNDESASGTMTDSNSPYAKNSTVTVLANSFTPPTGKVFVGWNTKANGTGASYNPDDTFSATADVTLFAQWAYPATGTGTINCAFVKDANTINGTVTGVSTISGISSSLTASTLSLGGGDVKDGYSVRITNQQTSYNDAHNVAYSFTVADNYTFAISSVSAIVFANGTGDMKAKVVITDGVSEIESNQLSCPNSADGTITFAADAFDGVKLEGTVTVKFYFWNKIGKRAYIKSPVTITGTVAAATPSCEDPETALSLSSNANPTIYVDDVITFSTTGGNGGTVSIAGANSETISENKWTATEGEHTFTAAQAKNGNYCAQEDVLVLTVNQKTPVTSAVISSDAADKDHVVKGSTVNLTCTAENATTWQWYLGDDPISGATSSTYSVTANTVGTFAYKVAASNSFNTDPVVSSAYSITVEQNYDIHGLKSEFAVPTAVLNLPTFASNTWNSNIDHGYVQNSNTYTISAYAAYQSASTQTWVAVSAGGSSEATWNATGVFAGSTAYMTTNASRCADTRWGDNKRSYSFRVKNATNASVLVNPNGNSGRKIYFEAYEVEANATTLGNLVEQQVLTTNAVSTLSLPLNKDKEYVLVVVNSLGSGARFYELALTFPPVAATGVTLNKSSLTLPNLSASEQLTATVLPATATNKNVTWSIYPEGFATVTNGLVEAVAAGEAVVTVTTQDGGFTATCNVKVEAGLSDDATLSDLTVGGETVEGFTAATEEYDVVLPFGTTAVPTVAGTANDANAKSVVVTQAPALPGSATVVVTAEDNSTKTYTINFTVEASKGLKLVWNKDVDFCSGDDKLSAAVKSDNAAVSAYINKITFTNVEGSGDDGAEGGSLNVGKKAGNMFTLSAKPGYAMKAMTFAAKIQDANCEYSLNGGAWQTLTSTGQSADKCYEVFANAEVHEFRLRSTGASGVWIRNMELTMIQACTPKTIAWTTAPASEYEVGATGLAIAASANNGDVEYAASNGAITVATNGALTINSLTNDIDLSATVAAGDGVIYCDAAASVVKEEIKTYYLVKFNAQNETAVSEVKYYSGDDAIALPTPSYSGYNFQGWFDAATGGNKITAAIIPTASRTVYAQWVAQCAGPTIETQPASANYFVGRTAAALSCAATPGVDGKALTYTWYSCDDAERTNPVELAGAPTPSTAAVGTFYYYCAVTEEDCDVIRNSNVVTINVTEKDQLLLIKIATTGKTDKTVTGYCAKAADCAVSLQSDSKFGTNSYMKMALDDEEFQEGDILNVHITAEAQGGSIALYSTNGSDEALLYNSGVRGVGGNNRVPLTDAINGYSTLFLCRTSNNGWNPYVDFIEVYRPYPVPVLTAMTVNGSAATISGTNVTATIASNAELASLTIVPTFMSNDPALTNGAIDGDWTEVSEGVYSASYVVTDKDGDTNPYTITLTRDVEIASVTISGETTVAAESQITLTATVLPNNVLNKEVTWSSSDETKAVVDANGVVTGKAAGAVTITATAVADNTKKGTYDITVTPFIGTKYAYWFTKTGDIPSDLANDNGDIFDGAPTDGSGLNASMTVEINGVDREFTVTRRSGDEGFGTFHVPAGFTADLYMLVQGSGDGRTIQLKETTTEATYKSDPESFGSSAAKLVFSAIPAGNYSYDKIGGNSRVAMMVAALNSYPLSSITLSDMTMRIGNTGKPAMTLDHAKAAITSQTWSIVENNAAGTTIDAPTGVITAGTTPGTVTVKVVAVDAMSNEVTSNTCTVTIVDIYERVDVTGDITWNWNEAANTSNVAVATANGLALANYINGEKWQKISGTHGDYAYNTNASGSYQGKGKLAFHTTVPGIVKITARRISNNAEFMLGERLIGELTSTVKAYPAMYVPAGEVEIIADATEGMRITKIEFKATADYTRTVNPSFLGTLCWTNNAVLGGATLYEFAGKNEYNYLVFDEVEENRLEAGKPYIFMPENGNTEIKVYNTDSEDALTEDQAPVNHMYGTIVGKTLVPGQDNDMYYFSSNHIWAVKDFNVNINVPAYYCYIDYPAVLADEPAPAPAPGRRRVTMGVNGKNTPTGIDAINASEQPMKLLINGQIFILRGEKMFDATGRLVK